MARKWSLEKTFIIYVSGLITLLVGLIAAVYIYMERQHTEAAIGEQALTTAKTIAALPEVSRALQGEATSVRIQELTETIREQVGARFVVIGDTEEIRHAHPIEARLGEKMVGGDNERALVHGESYISHAEGSLGDSVRGKSAVFDSDGEIIGVVSVGFLNEYVLSEVQEGLTAILFWTGLVFLIGVVGSVALARKIRADTFGLEPYQIGRLYQERTAILSSIKEGLLATDQEGRITAVNETAKRALNLTNDAIGTPVSVALPNEEMAQVMQKGMDEANQETVMNGRHFIANYKAMEDEDGFSGMVASFRDRSELHELLIALSEFQQYSKDLRAQTHEYTNKLYAISGWLQLGSTDKALAFIHEEMSNQQQHHKIIFEQIEDPTIQGILLGKLSKASEKRIELVINEESALSYRWPAEYTANLVTIIGNVIDNAFEAVAHQRDGQVDVFLTDIGADMVVEVTDNGAGISKAAMEQVFQRGFTTKPGEKRGVGLALVKEALDEVNGTVEIATHPQRGTVFSLFIPKKKEA
ncbi:ATP-binding protein [Shouchella shacheensis]|uniref:ATP-binding protein n=1 Tax=Shouchella shacheensis TaxID=1649580 RepID=UPI00074003BB|nr:sensor histidine kinase [Shouchella shacheensis]